MKEYGVLLIIIVISMIIGIVLEVASYIMAKKETEREKLAAFECGFDAFENSRDKFDVKFYLVGMLFIIFDLEASYLYPFAVTIESIGSSGIIGMVDFICELLLGIIYIYKVGALRE